MLSFVFVVVVVVVSKYGLMIYQNVIAHYGYLFMNVTKL